MTESQAIKLTVLVSNIEDELCDVEDAEQAKVIPDSVWDLLETLRNEIEALGKEQGK